MHPREKPSVPYRWTYDFIVPLRLYLDDLRDIFTVLAHIGAPTAETDSHVNITSIDELAELRGQPTHALRVVATNEHGSIEADFERSGASITITSARPEFVGALHRIQTIAWRHWRKFSLADQSGALGVLWLMPLMGGVVALYSTNAIEYPWNLAAAVGFAAIAIALLLIGRKERRTRWTDFQMVRYAERPPSFVKRNRDQFVLGSIFLILGYVLGWLRPPVGE